MKVALAIVTAVSGILAVGVSLPITRRELRRWPRLLWIERNRFGIGAGAIFLTVVAGILAILDMRRTKDPLQMTMGRTPTLTVTSSAVEREIDKMSSRQGQEAKDLVRSGETLMKNQEFAAAAKAFRRSAEYVPSKGALTNLAVCTRYTSNFDESIDAARRAIALPQSDDEDKLLHANAMLQLGITLTDAGKRDEARSFLLDAYQRFKQSRYNLGLANAEYAFGVLEYRGGNTKAAVAQFTSASARFYRAQDKLGLASVMNVLGVTKLEAGATDEGVKSLENAAALYRETGYRKGEAGALLNIGSARQDQCQLEAAILAYNSCAETARKIDNKFLTILATANAASALLERGDHRGAEQKAAEAMKMAADIKAPEGEAWTHLTLAGVYREQRRVEEAKSEVARAKAKFENVSAVGALVSTIEEARLAILVKRYDQAALLLQNAQTAAASSDYNLYRPSIFEVTADLWEAKGNRAEANKALMAARDLNRQFAIVNCAAKRIETRLRGYEQNESVPAG